METGITVNRLFEPVGGCPGGRRCGAVPADTRYCAARGRGQRGHREHTEVVGDGVGNRDIEEMGVPKSA